MYVAIQDAKYAVSSSEKLLRLSRWDSPFHRWNVPRNIYTFRYLINETWNTASIYSIMRSFVLLLFFFFLHLYVANCVNWNLVDWNVWLYSNFLELKMNNYSWIKTILFFFTFWKMTFPRDYVIVPESITRLGVGFNFFFVPVLLELVA